MTTPNARPPRMPKSTAPAARPGQVPDDNGSKPTTAVNSNYNSSHNNHNNSHEGRVRKPRPPRSAQRNDQGAASHTEAPDSSTVDNTSHIDELVATTPYGAQLSSLRELFSETWKDDDLVAVLQEVHGDLETAIARISEGHASQWATAGSRKVTRKDGPAKKLLESSNNRRGEYASRGRGGRGGSRGAAGPGRDSYKPAAPMNKSKDSGNSWAKSGMPEPKKVPSGWENTGPEKQSAPATSARSTDIKESASSASAWATDSKPNNEATLAASVADDKLAAASDNWSTSTQSGWGDRGTSSVASASPAKHSKSPALPPAKPSSTTAKATSTWAQIAKPQSPVSVAVLSPAVSPPKQREPSPKRAPSPARTQAAPAVPAATAPHVEEPRTTVPSNAPPGLAPKSRTVSAASTAVAPSAPYSAVVAASAPRNTNGGDVILPQMLNAGGMGKVGVKFGSLSLEESESAVKANTADSAATIARSPAAPQPVSSGAPVAVQPAQNLSGYGSAPQYAGAAQSLPQQPTSDYSANYGIAPGADARAAESGQPAVSQQQGVPPGYPAMNAASIANMYAAYFPYYMSQFPGANPYGSQGAPAAYGQQAQQQQQASFASMNKYPMYQNGAQSALPQTAGSSTPGNVPKMQQQQQQHLPNYGSNYGYNMQQQPQQQHGESTAGDYGSQHGRYSQYAMGGAASLQQHPKPEVKNDRLTQHSYAQQQQQQHHQAQQIPQQHGLHSGMSAANAAYYNQFMHPDPTTSGFPNLMAAGGLQGGMGYPSMVGNNAAGLPPSSAMMNVNPSASAASRNTQPGSGSGGAQYQWGSHQ